MCSGSIDQRESKSVVRTRKRMAAEVCNMAKLLLLCIQFMVFVAPKWWFCLNKYIGKLVNGMLTLIDPR